MSQAKRKAVEIVIQRAYEDPTPADGYRVLVDRFWPRGRSKEALKLDDWAKEIAPSAELIKWFGHAPERWEEFQNRYGEELGRPEQTEKLLEMLAAAGANRITLVYGAHNEEANQAIVIRDFIHGLKAT